MYETRLPELAAGVVVQSGSIAAVAQQECQVLRPLRSRPLAVIHLNVYYIKVRWYWLPVDPPAVSLPLLHPLRSR